MKEREEGEREQEREKEREKERKRVRLREREREREDLMFDPVLRCSVKWKRRERCMHECRGEQFLRRKY